ncbi:MAG: hypothetical protein BWY20_02167 [Spirochaetes bacterium ADurb.Bin215]|nr:MAG: hypothetical protein BWY20_02167 [Spirochaetes bacterium ADurb.Bin215]
MGTVMVCSRTPAFSSTVCVSRPVSLQESSPRPLSDSTCALRTYPASGCISVNGSVTGSIVITGSLPIAEKETDDSGPFTPLMSTGQAVTVWFPAGRSVISIPNEPGTVNCCASPPFSEYHTSAMPSSSLARPDTMTLSPTAAPASGVSISREGISSVWSTRIRYFRLVTFPAVSVAVMITSSPLVFTPVRLNSLTQ